MPTKRMTASMVDAALVTARSRLNYERGPTWQGSFWSLMWEGLTGRWEQIQQRPAEQNRSGKPQQVGLDAFA